MIKNLIIIGTGAVAAELTSYIDDTNMSSVCGLKIKGYLENEENIEKYYRPYKFKKPVLASIDDYKVQHNDYFVVGIANISFRKLMINKIKAKGGELINLVHPTAIIAETATLGEGNIINPYCMVGPNAKIGDFNILTSQSIISHDCYTGNNNVLSTALFCGHVNIGHDNFFGIRSTVIPHVNIGDRNVIQAGMIVDKDLQDDSTIFHRFKEKVIVIAK